MKPNLVPQPSDDRLLQLEEEARRLQSEQAVLRPQKLVDARQRIEALRGKYKGKGLMKAFMAEKKREIEKDMLHDGQ